MKRRLSISAATAPEIRVDFPADASAFEAADALAANKAVKTTATPKGTVYYFGLNQKNPNLAKPEVRQRMAAMGLEVRPGSPRELADLVAEQQRLGGAAVRGESPRAPPTIAVRAEHEIATGQEARLHDRLREAPGLGGHVCQTDRLVHVVAHDGADVYAMWADACGNPSLEQLCRSTTDVNSSSTILPSTGSATRRARSARWSMGPCATSITRAPSATRSGRRASVR